MNMLRIIILAGVGGFLINIIGEARHIEPQNIMIMCFLWGTIVGIFFSKKKEEK